MSSEIRRFFRHCPSCGRRFEISLVSKTLVSETVTPGEEESPNSTAMQDQVAPEQDTVISSASTSVYESGYAVLTEGKQPLVLDVKEFTYSYKCKHCGHSWSETRTTEKAIPSPR